MKYRNNKGQELVEFALILPIMVVVLVVLSEFGFMWSLRGTVSDAVKSSVQQMQSYAGISKTEAVDKIKANLKSYLDKHGVPNTSSVQVSISDDNNSDNSTVNITYTYVPTFTLANFFGVNLIPNSIEMNSVQMVNSATFKPNDFSVNTGLPNTTSVSETASILKDDPTVGQQHRKQVAFLIDFPGSTVDTIINWWGHSILPGSVGVNFATGTIMVRSPYNADAGGNLFTAEPNTNGWSDTGISFAGVLLAQGYTTLIYVDGNGGTSPETQELSSYGNIYAGDFGSALADQWCTPVSASGVGGNGTSCDGDISADGSSNLAVVAFKNIGEGYDIRPPAPSAKSGNESVTTTLVPISYSIPDKTYREVVYKDDNFAKLKMYFPKTKFTSGYTAPGSTITNWNDYLLMVIDADGDGIPAYWDLHPAEADADKNSILDGFQKRANNSSTLTYAASYPVNGGSIDGNLGVIPASNVSVPSIVGAVVSPGIFVSPDNTSLYADKDCAATGCSSNAPFFLRITADYKNSANKTISIPSDIGKAVYYNSEKYINPDSSKRIYLVEVFSRDSNSNGTIEITSGTPSGADDDGNDDGANSGINDDITSYGSTTGLLFVDTNGMSGFLGGSTFYTVQNGNPLTLGYSAVNPNNLNSITNMDPGLGGNKGTFTTP